MEQLNTRRSCGAHAAGASLVYSVDGKYLFQREAHVIRVINTKNGHTLHECIRAEHAPLSSTSSTSNANERHAVTSLALHPYNALQIIASYSDGVLLVWDFTEEKILQEFDAKAPILWMQSSVASPLMLILVIANTPNNATEVSVHHWSVMEFNMKKNRRGRTFMEHSKTPFVAASMHSIAPIDSNSESDATFSGDQVVVVAGTRVFAITIPRDSAQTNRAANITKHIHERIITTVAVAPTQGLLEFCIGDVQGKLVRYTPGPQTAHFHWHAHAVSCLTYSSDGQFVLSGGEECVLVMWHLETGRRSFLPRRSASLTCITPRHPLDGRVGYAITLADHSLFQYNSVTREQEWMTTGLARSGDLSCRTMPWQTMIWDPLTNTLPFNGVSSAGVLQLYDPCKDRVITSLALTERNQVTRTEQEEIPHIGAQFVVFNTDGNELITLHQPHTASSGEEQALRFWKRRMDHSFYLHTAIDAPHGNAQITSVIYSPHTHQECVVTGDEKGVFKVWKKTVITSSSSDTKTISTDQVATIWHCHSMVQFRSDAIQSMAFSSDGSLLAVVYNHLVTLWDLQTMSLQRTISSADGQSIQTILFMDTSPYLVIQTISQLQIWNLLTMSLWWCYRIPTETLVTTHETQLYVTMNVADPTDPPVYLVMVFTPETSVPIEMYPISLSEQVWCTGVHPVTKEIIVIDRESNVWRIKATKKESTTLETDKRTMDETSPLAAMFKQIQSEKQTSSFQTRGDTTSVLFDAPAHTLPSMTSLYRSFMDQMLLKSNKQNKPEEEEIKKKKTNKKRKKQDIKMEMEIEDIIEKDQDQLTKQLERELENHTLIQSELYSSLRNSFRKKKKIDRMSV